MNTISSQRSSFKQFLTVIALSGFLLFCNAQVRVRATSNSQRKDTAQIDAYVQKEMQAAGIPGLAYGIVEGDQIVHLQAFGMADSTGRPVTPQTPFLIGSVGKNITALAIQQLVQVGKVSLDMPVQTYIPWFRLADMEAARQITLRQLLNHTSGISNGDGTNLDYYRSDRFTNEEIVRSLDQVKLDRPVGSSMEYSNLNYLILGQVIAQVSGQTYDAYVQQHILSPLEMQHTFMSLPEAQADGLAQGHRILFGFTTPTQLPYVRGIMSAGNHISTVEDMSHLLIANLNQGNYQGISVLTQDGKPSNEDQEKPFYDVHWIPWKTIPRNMTDAQSGGSLEYAGCIYLLPTFHIGVVVLTNANTAETFPTKSAQTIAFDILEMYSGFSGRSTEMSIKTLYIGINFLLLVGAGFLFYRVLGLRKWKQKMNRQYVKTRWNLLPTFLVDLGFPIVLLLGLPLLIRPLFAPGLSFEKTWPLITYTHPDLSYSIWAFSVVLLLVGVIKLIWLLKWAGSNDPERKILFNAFNSSDMQ